MYFCSYYLQILQVLSTYRFLFIFFYQLATFREIVLFSYSETLSHGFWFTLFWLREKRQLIWFEFANKSNSFHMCQIVEAHN